MTKEEAIIILENEKKKCEAYDIAIESLKRESIYIEETLVEWVASRNPPTKTGNYLVTFGYLSYATGVAFWNGEQWDIKSTVYAWAEFPQPCEISEVFI